METTKNFKPILFNTEMVQAISAGRKTQTRRFCKISPEANIMGLYTKRRLWDSTVEENPNPIAHIAKFNWGEVKSKYKIGDILWVRETHKVASWNSEEDKVSFYYKASPGENFPMVNYDSDDFEKIFEKTISELDRLGEGEINNVECTVTYKFPAGDNPLKWKPSLFMPKEAARIFLKLTNVRCERLQDISEEDAVAEGIERYGPFGEFKGDPHPSGGMMRFRAYRKAARAFQDLWDSINAKKYPWKSNPWVWVYDFEKIEKPENFN